MSEALRLVTEETDENLRVEFLEFTFSDGSRYMPRQISQEAGPALTPNSRFLAHVWEAPFVDRGPGSEEDAVAVDVLQKFHALPFLAEALLCGHGDVVRLTVYTYAGEGEAATFEDGLPRPTERETRLITRAYQLGTEDGLTLAGLVSEAEQTYKEAGIDDRLSQGYEAHKVHDQQSAMRQRIVTAILRKSDEVKRTQRRWKKR